jgi:hypothetical protein
MYLPYSCRYPVSPAQLLYYCKNLSKFASVNHLSHFKVFSNLPTASAPCGFSSQSFLFPIPECLLHFVIKLPNSGSLLL